MPRRPERTRVHSTQWEPDCGMHVLHIAVEHNIRQWLTLLHTPKASIYIHRCVSQKKKWKLEAKWESANLLIFDTMVSRGLITWPIGHQTNSSVFYTRLMNINCSFHVHQSFQEYLYLLYFSDIFIMTTRDVVYRGIPLNRSGPRPGHLVGLEEMPG